jgi:hypothetical protein
METTFITPTSLPRTSFHAKTARALLVFSLLLLTLSAQAITYYWVGASGANWNAASSWNTAPNGSGSFRTTAATADFLIFSGGTPTATVNVNQNITRLTVTNNADVTLNIFTSNNTNTVRNLTISNGAGTDLVVDSGSQLTVVGNGANGSFSSANLNLIFNAGATASIGGDVIFKSQAGNANCAITHQCQAAANAIHFVSGGSFTTQGNRYTGQSFSNTTGIAVFEGGSSYWQDAGSDPYGRATFIKGSTYTFSGGTTPVVDGREYPNLTFEASSNQTLVGTNGLTVTGNLVLTAANSSTIRFTMTGGINLEGNIIVDGGTLAFAPSAASNVTFEGTTLQTISGNSPTFNGNATLVLNNPGGLTLNTPILVREGLTLTNGKLNTATGNILTLVANANVTGGSDNSFVNGPMNRTYSPNSVPNTTALEFPIGAGSSYRPLTLTATQNTTDNTTYTAQQFEGSPTTRIFPIFSPTSIKRVSQVRYFSVTNNGATNFTSGTIKLSYGINDRVDAPAKLRVAKSAGGAGPGIGNWVDMGGTGTAAPSGSITSSASFTTFSDFALAAIDVTAGAGNNPLPVELTSFAATPQEYGVAVRWTTASEKNNQYFELQRGTDGQTFKALGRIEGQGTSQTARSYVFLDSQPIAGINYYRLRQVDFDGTENFSPVVAARWKSSVLASSYPNPTTGTLFLPVAEGSQYYRILNTTGQVVQNGEASGSLNVEKLPSGTYFLELTGPAGASTQRIVRL